MSLKYNKYLAEHVENVERAFGWVRDNLPDVALNVPANIIGAHDLSKYDEDEYSAYDAYFYGSEKTDRIKEAFDRAWLHHIHANPHHWQHWVLINDDESDGTKALDIPYPYIVEMICDWWSFSWKTDRLDEIFKWYDEHKDRVILSSKTRKTVEDILDKIRRKLGEMR